MGRLRFRETTTRRLAFVLAILWPLAASWLAGGCDTAVAPGRFQVAFTWADPPQGEVFLWARIEERTDPRTPGTRLLQSGPVRYSPGTPTELKLASVPNGANRVVILEARAGTSVELPVLYFGFSERFTMRPGRDTEVAVVLQLQPVGSGGGSGKVEIWLGDVPHPPRGTLATVRHATVRTWSTGAEFIQLANDPSFSAHLREIHLSDETGGGACRPVDPGTGATTCEVVDWDLTADIATVEGGAHTVYARFIDRYGYPLAVEHASVIRDSSAPALLSASIAPSPAAGGQTVAVVVNLSERLLAPRSSLSLEPPPVGLIFSGPEQIGDSTSYQWSAEVAPDAPDAEYALSVTLADELGTSVSNLPLTREDGQPLRLVIDAAAPRLAEVGPSVPERTLFGPPQADSATEVHVPFVLREAHPRPELPQVLLGGRALGLVRSLPERTSDADGLHAFEFVYAVEAADWKGRDQDAVVTVRWADTAGNLANIELPLTAPLHFDFVPPQAVDCALVPATANAASTVSYSVSGTEPLGEIRLTQGGPEPLMNEADPQVSRTVSADRFAFRWTRSAMGLPDGEYTLSAQLTDVAGNLSESAVCAATVRLDTTPPALAGEPQINQTRFNRADRANGVPLLLTFEVDEIGPGPAPPTVFVDGVDAGPGTLVASNGSRRTYELAYDSSSEPDVERDLALEIRAADEAGNEAAFHVPQRVHFDFLAPRELDCALTPERVGAHSVAHFSLTASEALATAELHLPAGGPFSGGDGAVARTQSADRRVFTWDAHPPHSAVDGEYPQFLTLTDDAGNSAEGICARVLILDETPPVLDPRSVSWSPSPAVFALADATSPPPEPLAVEFTFQEAAPATEDAEGSPCTSDCPQVLLGGRAVGAVRSAGNPADGALGLWRFRYEYPVVAADWGPIERDVELTVRWRDAAGNPADVTLPGVAHLDSVPPRAADCLLLPESGVANRRSRLRFSVAASEELGGAPVLVAGSPFEGAPRLAEAGRVYEWTREAADVPDGQYAVGVHLVDAAGNRSDPQSPACAGSVRIDGSPIEVVPDQTRVQVVYETPDGLIDTGVVARDGAWVSIEFELDDTPAQLPDLQLGDFRASSCPDCPDCPAVSSDDGRTFRYEQFIHRSGPDAPCGALEEGSHAVSVRLTDDAGNVTERRLGTLTTDYTPPALVGRPYFARDDESERARVDRNDVFARSDSTVRISFGIDERARVLPSVAHLGRTVDVVGSGPGSDAFDVTVPPPAPGAVESLLDADLPPEAQVVASPVVARVQDMAGNLANLELGTIRHDHIPPLPLTAETQPLVRLFRAPWGAAETGGRAETSLRTCPGPWDWCVAGASPFEDRTRLRVFPTVMEANGTLECASDALAVFEDHAANLGLPGDVASVCISQIDRAGNESAAAAIRGATWVATMGRKVVGDLVSNPNRFEVRPWFKGSLVDDTSSEAGPLVAAMDGAVLATSVSERWLPRSGAFPNSVFFASTFDAGRGVYVRLDRQGETWEYDGAAQTWSLRRPLDPEGDGNPSAREEEALAYDARRGVVVMYGGTSGRTETWEWNGVSWALRVPPAECPDSSPPAYRHSLAYDTMQGKTMLFGNQEAGPAELWAWDGVCWSRVWVATEGVDGPQRLTNVLLAYDTKRQRLITYGGHTISGYHPVDELWEWDGQRWLRPAPEDPEGDGDPGRRTLHGSAYDVARGVTVMYGGRDGGPQVVAWEGPQDSTWEWDGVSWRRCQVEDPEGDGNPTGGDVWSAMAYDPGRQRTILVTTGVTWEWDGVSWSRRVAEADPSPAARVGAAMAADPTRKCVVLFGGNGRSGPLGDTWRWCGGTWSVAAAEDPSGILAPVPRIASAMASDHRREVVVLFGGAARQGGTMSSANDTWEWDGERWYRPPISDPEGDGEPPVMSEHAMAYDAPNENVVLVGRSADLAFQQWSWDGRSWRRQSIVPPAPMARVHHRLAEQRGTDGLLLFGGYGLDGQGNSALDDATWAWDGSGWSIVAPAQGGGAAAPGPHEGHGMAFDMARGQTVLVGGDSMRPSDFSWVWNGQSWRVARPVGAVGPVNRYVPAVAADPATRGVLVFGGLSLADAPDRTLGDTWLWDGGAGSSPAHVMRVPWSAAAAPPTAAITSISSRFQSGASSEVGGDIRGGVRLLAWLDGHWVELDRNAAHPGMPGNVAATVSDERMVRMFVGEAGAVGFAVTPLGAAGVDGGELTTDDAEVRVDYEVTP